LIGGEGRLRCEVGRAVMDERGRDVENLKERWWTYFPSWNIGENELMRESK